MCCVCVAAGFDTVAGSTDPPAKNNMDVFVVVGVVFLVLSISICAVVAYLLNKKEGALGNDGEAIETGTSTAVDASATINAEMNIGAKGKSKNKKSKGKSKSTTAPAGGDGPLVCHTPRTQRYTPHPPLLLNIYTAKASSFALGFDTRVCAHSGQFNH